MARQLRIEEEKKFWVSPTLALVPWMPWDQRGKESEDAPEEYSCCHQVLSGVPIAQVAKDWSEQHVGDDEGSLQNPRPCVVCVKLLLDLIEHTSKDEPVHVVDEIDKHQHRHGQPLLSRHLWVRVAQVFLSLLNARNLRHANFSPSGISVISFSHSLPSTEVCKKLINQRFTLRGLHQQAIPHINNWNVNINRGYPSKQEALGLSSSY